MPDLNLHNLEPFTNPKVVEFLTDAMQKQTPTKFSNEERTLLSTNPALAERVFNGGLNEAIIKGKASITELSKLPQEVLESITYGFTKNALIDGTLKISQLSALDNDKGKEFAGLVVSGKTPDGRDSFDRITEILGLDKDQSTALLKSFKDTEHNYQEGISPRIEQFRIPILDKTYLRTLT